MNTNADVYRVLCYGDSNTWGKISSPDGKRYPANVRWTGCLQKNLGDRYEIIEEGLSSRTTALDDPLRGEEKNGKKYLIPCLETHNPIDIVILFLGTNDLKERFNQTPESIALNIEGLIKIIQKQAENNNEESPKIILISPPLVDESVPGVQDNYRGAEEKSKKLGYFYQKVAQKYSCEFVDIAKYVTPHKIDGYHLSAESHAKIAEILTQKLKGILST